MIQCSDSLIDYCLDNNKVVYLDYNTKGCSGNSVEIQLVSADEALPGIWIEYDYFLIVSDKFDNNPIDLYVDYINSGLFKGAHVSIKNATTCGCGKSFSKIGRAHV